MQSYNDIMSTEASGGQKRQRDILSGGCHLKYPGYFVHLTWFPFRPKHFNDLRIPVTSSFISMLQCMQSLILTENLLVMFMYSYNCMKNVFSKTNACRYTVFGRKNRRTVFMYI